MPTDCPDGGSSGRPVPLFFSPVYDCPVEHRGQEGLKVRPPLNETLFPVHRPSGLKRADWNFFFIFSKTIFFFTFPPLYILVYTNMKLKKRKKDSRLTYWPFFYSPGGQKTIIHLCFKETSPECIPAVKTNLLQFVLGNTIYLLD